MIVTTNLPAEVKGFHFVKNHHFVELEDHAGNKIKLNADAILLGQCTACQERVVALSNNGAMMCTHCGGNVKWSWSRPQLAFIPEEESKFMGWAVHLNPKDKKA